MKKPGFDLDEHGVAGRFLADISEQMVHLSVNLANSYPHNHRAVGFAGKVESYLNRLRCELDTVVCTEHRGLEDNIRIYYAYAGKNPPERPENLFPDRWLEKVQRQRQQKNDQSAVLIPIVRCQHEKQI